MIPRVSDPARCPSSPSGIPVLAFVLIVAVSLILVCPAAATPPSAMSVSYQEIAKELSVTITHQTANPQVHYIKEVLITINGNTVTDAAYTSQPTRDTFTYTYPIVTRPGDEITVTATCVLGGSLSRTLYNTGTIATTPPPASIPTRKAAAGLAPLLGAAAVILIRKK